MFARKPPELGLCSVGFRSQNLPQKCGKPKCDDTPTGNGLIVPGRDWELSSCHRVLSPAESQEVRSFRPELRAVPLLVVNDESHEASKHNVIGLPGGTLNRSKCLCRLVEDRNRSETLPSGGVRGPRQASATLMSFGPGAGSGKRCGKRPLSRTSSRCLPLLVCFRALHPGLTRFRHAGTEPALDHPLATERLARTYSPARSRRVTGRVCLR